jgi:hypothetical protein
MKPHLVNKNPYKLVGLKSKLGSIPRTMQGDNQKDLISNLFLNQLLRPKQYNQLSEDAYFGFKSE